MAGREVTTKAEPGSPEWLQTISGSKIAAIMEVSRWETAFSLWHRMKGNRPPEPPKDIYTVGHAMELAMADYYIRHRDEKGMDRWSLSKGEVQYTNPDLAFPNIATMDRRASRGRGRRVIEFKTARDLEDWGDLKGSAVPADYYVQVIWNMGISGFTTYPAHLVFLGPFFNFHIYEIHFNEELFAAMLDKAAIFYSSLALGIEPEFTGAPPDYTTVKEMHPDINGETVILDPELHTDYLAAVEALNGAKVEHDTLKAKVAHVMGSAQFAAVEGKVALKRAKSGRGITIKQVKQKETD